MSKADEMLEELEEAKVLLSNLKNTTNTQEYVNNFSTYDKAMETVLNYIDNSISKEVIKEKMEEIQSKYEKSIAKIDLKELQNINIKNFKGIQLEGQREILQEILEGK